jgi:hypothetical protein
MRYRHDADLFIEFSEEAGLENVTLDDATILCAPFLEEVPGKWNEGRPARCDRAVQKMTRPGRWDRW